MMTAAAAKTPRERPKPGFTCSLADMRILLLAQRDDSSFDVF
jgi:hypothetical protein